MRCSCDWTTPCFNAVSKHITLKFVHELGNTAVTALNHAPRTHTVNIRFLWLVTVSAHGQYNHRLVNVN